MGIALLWCWWLVKLRPGSLCGIEYCEQSRDSRIGLGSLPPGGSRGCKDRNNWLVGRRVGKVGNGGA